VTEAELVELWARCLAAAAAGAAARIGRSLWGDEASSPPAEGEARRAWIWRRNAIVLGYVAALPAVACIAALGIDHGLWERTVAELGSVVIGVLGPSWARDRLRDWAERRIGE